MAIEQFHDKMVFSDIIVGQNWFIGEKREAWAKGSAWRSHREALFGNISYSHTETIMNLYGYRYLKNIEIPSGYVSGKFRVIVNPTGWIQKLCCKISKCVNEN